MSGRIVILNGAPRSGKTSLARAVQRLVPGTWLNLGVDVMAQALPESLQPGIGLRPGGERPDLERAVLGLYRAFFQTIRAHALEGFDVVADLGLHEDYSYPLPIFTAAATALVNLDPLLVGIACDLDEIMRRRNADLRDGFYVGGETPSAPILRWQSIHEGRDHDLWLDMGRLDPEQGAARIGALLAAPPARPVLSLLAAQSS